MRKGQAKTSTYNAELRKIALTLHFYSPRGYQYARQLCGNLLPAASTLRRYYSVLDGNPGFTEEALKAIKIRSRNQPVVCNLVLDEISIRERLHASNSKLYGVIDLGTGIQDSCDRDTEDIPMANKALVVMAVSLKERWKVPIGYFITRSLDGDAMASLVTTSL